MSCTCEDKGDKPTGAYAVLSDNVADSTLKALIVLHKEITRTRRLLFDKSNPVDEYSFLTTPPVSGVGIQIQPDYEITERIESITVSIPVGCTLATLQLDQRIITLYSGAATSAQTLVNLVGLGVLLDRTDVRTITFTGTMTSGYYVGLAGFCFERWGDR